MSTKPVTRAAFAKLVVDLRAELAEVDEERRAELFKVPRRAVPAAWRGRPWARDYVNASVVTDLTGLARTSVRLYDVQARQARLSGDLTVTYNYGGRPHLRRLMPPSDKEKESDGANTRRRRLWMLGEIALWIAAREDRQVTTGSMGQVTPGVPHPESADDEEILEAARQVVAAHGVSAGTARVNTALRGMGVRAGPKRISPLLARARLERIQAAAGPAADGRETPLESLRPDGLVTGGQIARTYGIGPGAVTQARKRETIRVAKWESWRGELRPLYDPARLWVRADGGTGPVDKDSEYAADISLE